jgi:integrase
MLTDFRKTLSRVTVPAGWTPGAITPKQFRHAYCSARLQTLDRGAPVSQDTVARELGHSSTDLVQQVYGQPGSGPRHRSEVVEYRVEQHAAILRDRLEALYRRVGMASGTSSGTNALEAR